MGIFLFHSSYMDRFSRSGDGPLRCSFRLFPILLLLCSCATASTPGSFPHLLVEASESGRGWPFGESGRGPVQILTETSREEVYGWTSKKPIGLGGYDSEVTGQGPLERQQRFLNSLWGPNGDIIFYERIGACCPFDLFGAPLDKGMLDVYALTWDGLAEPEHLFLDRYREGPVRIPVGLITKVKQLLAYYRVSDNLGFP